MMIDDGEEEGTTKKKATIVPTKPVYTLDDDAMELVRFFPYIF